MSNLTTADLSRMGIKIPIAKPPVDRPTFITRKFGNRGAFGGRQKHKSGQMNGTERKYADHLETLYRTGAITWYSFEATTFKLAADTRYTPDFTVLLANGVVEFHEVKGTSKNKKTGEREPFIEPAAKIKIKVAAEILPFRFSLFWLDKSVPGGWARRDYWETA